MTLRKSLSLSFALAAGLAISPSLESPAWAEDFALEFTTPAVCETEGGSTVRIVPGMYLPKKTYDRLEDDYKQSQNQVTRLEAENQALKEYDSGPAWYWMALTFGAGITAGWYASRGL